MKIDQLKHLSKAEKILLVEDLWDSIADDYSGALSVSLKDTLDKRLKLADTTQERLSWDELKNNVRKNIRK